MSKDPLCINTHGKCTSFGKQASVYATGRPGYPYDLYRWISENCNAHQCVWDVGTGSGQAARNLTAYFDHVHATDISDAQIKAAKPHAQITYLTTPAHISTLPDEAVDAVTVATALHWFADGKFWAEVRRVAKPGALFAAWTYTLPSSETAAQAEFLNPVLNLIDPYWAKGNRLCMAGYTAEALNCPYPTRPVPKLDAGGIWTGQKLVNFVESWSAHFRARQNGLDKALGELSQNFLDKYADEALVISLPISLLAAKILK